MGCCFGKNETEDGEDERSPLISNAQTDYQSAPQCVVIATEPEVTNNGPTVENTAQSFQFIPIDQNTSQAKDHSHRSAFYRERLGGYLREAKVHRSIPNVIDPTTVLLFPCTSKDELEQVNQSSRTVANLLEQMRPKSKEPITTVALD